MLLPRIVVVTPGTFSLPSQYCSSVERVVQEVSKNLSNEFCIQIFVKKGARQPVKETIGDVQYIRPSVKSKKQYWNKVKRHIRKSRPHFIQIENRPRYAYLIKKQFPHIPVFLTLHSLTFVSPPYIKQGRLQKYLKRIDGIVVNSLDMKKQMVKRVPSISHKITVIYLGVDEQAFCSRWTDQGQQMKQMLKQQLGYGDQPIVLFVGRLIKQKGIHVVLHALPEMIEQNPNMILVIIGSPFYGKQTMTPYVKEIHRIGNRYPQHVRFIPYVPHDELPKWYCAAELMVVPTQTHEAFGLVNVEAMSSGLPIIASHLGGMPEIIEDGHTGSFITDPAQPHLWAKQINQWLADTSQLKRMGMYARERVESQFTWHHTAERWRKLYLKYAKTKSQ